MQSVKRTFKANKGCTTIQHKLDKFLPAYCVSPHGTTEQSPCSAAVRPEFANQIKSAKSRCLKDSEPKADVGHNPSLSHLCQGVDRDGKELPCGAAVDDRNNVPYKCLK